MTRSRAIRRTARDSSGAVLVLVALSLPVFVGFAGLVLDVGNWFAHNRHLQVQADAGALAGAGKFRYPCDNAAILDEISKYSSVELVDPEPDYNPQIGGTPSEELHQELNSTTYFDQPTPVDESVQTGQPCEAKMIDVKLTETDLPWWLKAARVPFINAHARVEFKQQTIATGALPVGVPEVDPKKVSAIFVDESKAPSDPQYQVAPPIELVESDISPGLWSNAALPASVTIDRAKIGVRIAVSAGASTTCGEPLVACYDAGAGDDGLVHVRGWLQAAGSATAPKVQNVALLAGSCEDAYFTATAVVDPCTVDVAADVAFGGASIATIRIAAVKAGGLDKDAVELAAPTTSGGTWTGGALSVARGDGPVGIELRWRTGCDVDRTKKCTTKLNSLETAHRTFASARARSGPVELVRISEGGVGGANSFRRCDTADPGFTSCTHDLVVTVDLQDNLQNATSVDEDPVELKVTGGTSQNQGLDCGPLLSNLKDELARGCEESYAVNEGTACPSTSALWDSPEPWQCVAVLTGAQTNQVAAGMNLRMFGDENSDVCTAPNNWADFPDFPAGDPRIVQVFLTPFGAFDGSGSDTVPVTGFASFYVTGWKGSGEGFANPCADPDDDAIGKGTIVGHFIKYIDTINNGDGGEAFCDFDAFGSCVAVFTR